MHSINLFSDTHTRQVEALTHKSLFRRFIESTHSGGGKWQPGVKVLNDFFLSSGSAGDNRGAHVRTSATSPR